MALNPCYSTLLNRTIIANFALIVKSLCFIWPLLEIQTQIQPTPVNQPSDTSACRYCLPGSR